MCTPLILYGKDSRDLYKAEKNCHTYRKYLCNTIHYVQKWNEWCKYLWDESSEELDENTAFKTADYQGDDKQPESDVNTDSQIINLIFYAELQRK